jgi:hypothetical protein
MESEHDNQADAFSPVSIDHQRQPADTDKKEASPQESTEGTMTSNPARLEAAAKEAMRVVPNELVNKKTAEAFIKLVHDLPRELFEMIYENVFATVVPESTKITVDNEWKPPAVLHIDRQTRTKLMETYYGRSTFHFFSEDYYDQDLQDRWLRSLSPDARRHLVHGRGIYVHAKIPNPHWQVTRTFRLCSEEGLFP